MDKKNLQNLKRTPLGRFMGTLVHDHETALFHFGTAHAECNVHILRYLTKNSEDTGNKWSEAMKKWLCDMNKARKRRIADGQSFTEDELAADTLDLRVKRDHVPYDIWERQGFIMTTEGNVIHYGYIEQFIERLGERFNIREIAFDRWGAVQMVQNLEGMGFTVVPFGQGFKDMSPPTKELMKLVLEKRIGHGGHPVLRWMMDNIFIRTDPAGNIKADKEKSTEKIDGAVATIMALDRAIRCGLDTGESVYDTRGLLSF